MHPPRAPSPVVITTDRTDRPDLVVIPTLQIPTPTQAPATPASSSVPAVGQSPFARYVSDALGRADAAFASELEKGVEGFKAAFCVPGPDGGDGMYVYIYIYIGLCWI